MSSHEQALVSLFSQLALSFDGAVLGLALAYAAVRSVIKFTANSAALGKVRAAPSLSVSDLRSLLESPDAEGNSGDCKLVIVRGTVEAKSTVDNSWKSFRPSVLVSRESGDKAVVVQRTQTVFFFYHYLLGEVYGCNRRLKGLALILDWYRLLIAVVCVKCALCLHGKFT